MIILIKLVLAHFLGDFLFQPNAWIHAKEDRKLRSYQLYIHALLHGVLVFIIVWDLNFWIWALAIVVLHFLIDSLKILVQKDDTKRSFFFIDQFLHLASIGLIWVLSQKDQIHLSGFTINQTFLLITALFFLVQPASLSIKNFIIKWSPDTGVKNYDSLNSAGRYIGILERLFVFVFVIINQWEAIGFLLAAKSVFRFGDLKESKDIKLTEYVLIGTLASFGTAILIGLIYNYLWSLL